MKSHRALRSLVAGLLTTAMVLAASCLWIDWDDEDDDCILCETTGECFDALGEGWVCQDGCCEEYEDGDDDDDDDDNDDDDTNL